MFRKPVTALFIVFALAFVALAATASGYAPEDLEGGIVCRFDHGDHDEWGYWKAGETEVGLYIVLGWTWPVDDNGFGYSVTDDEGAQAGPFTLAEFRSYIAPYLDPLLPYGCPPIIAEEPEVAPTSPPPI